MNTDEFEKTLKRIGFQFILEGENKDILRTVKYKEYRLEYHGWYIEIELVHDDKRNWMNFAVSYEKDNYDAHLFINSADIQDVNIDEDEDSFWIGFPFVPSFRINKK